MTQEQHNRLLRAAILNNKEHCMADLYPRKQAIKDASGPIICVIIIAILAWSTVL